MWLTGFPSLEVGTGIYITEEYLAGGYFALEKLEKHWEDD